MSRRGGILLLAVWLAAGGAAADGGQVVLRDSRGAWIVTLLAHPVPLRAGPVAFSVLVQDRDGAPVEARVQLRFSGPGLHHPVRVPAGREGANRLFREVRVELPQPGSWEVEVEVSQLPQSAVIRTELEVGPRLGKLRRYWSAIALGPIGALVIALHQARVLSVKRRPRRRALVAGDL